MLTIEEILNTGLPDHDIIANLKEKQEYVPKWRDLMKEYDPLLHPVMNRGIYPDIVKKDGTVEYVTRIPFNFQKLAAHRLTELCFGIPVKRVYKSFTDGEKEVAGVIEAILQRNRIDSLNINRSEKLFSGCEIATLWYAVEERNSLYGIDSPIKLRCQTFSPMDSHAIYPLFDDTNDLIAISFETAVKNGRNKIDYFDTYTSDRHIKWERAGRVTGWQRIQDEKITIGKIPAIYTSRELPAWENTSNFVFESEMTLSRNGNYLRKNMKPLFVLFADEEVSFGNEKDDDHKSVFRYPKGSDARYVTWAQAIESLKFQITELRQQFYSQLQLPDFSMDNMKTTPMSGEARKMVFIDSQLKVTREKGALLEFLDREINVIRSFVKIIMPARAKDVDDLQIETVITPFTITDEKDTVNNLMTATGGKPIISQKEGIEYLGWSDDPDATLAQIAEESKADIFNPTI